MLTVIQWDITIFLKFHVAPTGVMYTPRRRSRVKMNSWSQHEFEDEKFLRKFLQSMKTLSHCIVYCTLVELL